VFNIGDEPVRLGLVRHRRPPGGNRPADLTAKRLELLREMMPAATRRDAWPRAASQGALFSIAKEVQHRIANGSREARAGNRAERRSPDSPRSRGARGIRNQQIVTAGRPGLLLQPPYLATSVVGVEAVVGGAVSLGGLSRSILRIPAVRDLG